MFVIVGGSGFVGTRLCGQLGAVDAEFLIVDKVPSKAFGNSYVQADVRDVDSLRAAIPAGVAALVNLAAEHKDDIHPLSLYEEVNVDGARKVCQVATEKGVKTIVFTSSVACYGFAPCNTDESGKIAPFNEYGRTKYAAEDIYRAWQAEDALNRCLVIVRPTVIFGEKNRGNVYNLLKQVMSGRFVMVGDGYNIKSMAYVENVAAFLVLATTFTPGVHLYNYVDKPDLSMNDLLTLIRKHRAEGLLDRIRIPYALGYIMGAGLDLVARITRRTFPISAIRVKKFCATTQFATSMAETGFKPPVTLLDGLEQTIKYEFDGENVSEHDVFYSE